MLNEDSQWAVRLPRTFAPPCPSQLPPPPPGLIYFLLFKVQIFPKSSLTILSKALHPPRPTALTHFPLSHYVHECRNSRNALGRLFVGPPSLE